MAATVAPVTAAEYATAGRLLCGAGSAFDLARRVDRFVGLIESGALDPAGVLLAKQDGEPVAAAAVQFLPGGSAVVIPPVSSALTPRPPLQIGEGEMVLAEAIVTCLREQSAPIAYAFLDAGADHLADPLLPHGFRAVTRITHMLRTGGAVPPPSAAVRFIPAHDHPAAFEDALLASYDGTLDVPEACCGRAAADILAGYRASQPDPPLWWLAVDSRSGDDARPVGVLLLTVIDTPGVMELGYLGVVPEARGRGVGKALLRYAVRTAAAHSCPDLNLSVDERNEPALQLYRAHGFRPYQWQRVVLWRPSW
jgi:ribosomal protein S18 acetylase RimI-like enzyme